MRRGFTLIELVIVMAIILILAGALSGPAHVHLMMAHETAAISQIRTIQIAETAYYGSFGKYPANLAALEGMIPKGLAGGRKEWIPVCHNAHTGRLPADSGARDI
jgi:prepilin-type N-terminal cleavage/methylation domain-containing protein